MSDVIRRARELLRERRRAEERRLAARALDLSGVASARSDATSDDEHDPEGATIGFERAQVAALTASARHTLDDVDAALERPDDGSSATCLSCGQPVAPARLEPRRSSTRSASREQRAAR